MKTVTLTFGEVALIEALLSSAIMDTGSNKAAAVYEAVYLKIARAQSAPLHAHFRKKIKGVKANG